MRFFLSTMMLILSASFFTPAQSRQEGTGFINLQLSNYKINVNGQTIISVNGKCGGQVLAFNLPRPGWLVASAQPIAGYEFQKIGKLKGRRLSFVYDNRRYEIINDQPMGSRNEERAIWVLRIPALFNDEEPTGGGVVSCSSDFKYFLETNVMRKE